jgi:hypothetical protein
VNELIAEGCIDLDANGKRLIHVRRFEETP